VRPLAKLLGILVAALLLIAGAALIGIGDVLIRVFVFGG